MQSMKLGFAAFSCVFMLVGTAPDGFANPVDTSVAGQTQAAPLTSQQLQQLVAPIALYPDTLVAQILAAATYPVDIVDAERWMQAHPALQGDALASAVGKQSWAPGVRALTAFPSILANMDRNLDWTSSLGNAYLIQPQQLMAAVQVMRQRAVAAGNLQSTDRQTVSTEDEAITIDPANADVVYLPEYDPWSSYGTPVAVWPGWYPSPVLYLAGPGMSFGEGVFVGHGYIGDHTWGWHHWSPNWKHKTVDYNHHAYDWHARVAIDPNGLLRAQHDFHHIASPPAIHGFSGMPASHPLAMPQRGYTELHAGAGMGIERPTAGGFAHDGAGFHGEGISHEGGRR